MSDRRAAFDAEGYVVVRRLVGARTVATLTRGVIELERAGRHLGRDGHVRGALYRVQSATGRPHEEAVAPGAFRKIMFPSKAHRAFARFLGDERMHAVLAELGVTRPDCLVDQVNPKPPGVGTGFPWHQDTYFLTPKQREQVEREGGVHVVLALDAADQRNGGFEVLPGSHRGGARTFDYDTGVADLAAGSGGAFDDSDRTLLPLAPGDAVFFHPWLVHGSGPNLSDLPRRLLTWWFVQSA